MKLILVFFLTLFIVSCNDSGEDGGFSSLEDTVEDSGSNIIDEPLEILSTSPSSSSVVLTANEQRTFAIQVNSGAGEVQYTFKLDGSLLQDSNSPFYNLDASVISSGTHSLEILARNSVSSDSHTFTVRKNTTPTINLDSNTSQTISCVNDSFQLDITASDVDSDSLTYSFYLNGVLNSSYLSTSTGMSSATSIFTPNCSLAGNNNVTIRVTDTHGEFSEYSIAVNVTNPNVTSIDSYSPTANPVVILSNDSVNFLVSASGNPPLTYSWDITPGSTIASCNNLSSCSLSGGDFSPGNYVLKATVEDSLSTSDNHEFNILINQKPQISFQVPSSASKIKMNCSSSKNFQLNISDANWSDGQRHTVTWLFDGGANSALTSTTDLGVHPVTSDATFSPNCQAALIGDHKIKAIISDGYETQEVEWDVTVNYFSDVCNNLNPGEICTVAGLVGMGSGLNSSHPQLRIRPEYLERYPGGGYFFTDTLRHSVWFYNETNGDLTVLGKTVAAKSVTNLFGSTNYGLGADGQSYNNFYLNSPRGLAYSANEDALYVADYSNHQIVRFNSAGKGYRWAGKSNGNIDGNTRKSHKCNYPIGLTIDDSEGKVFAACYGNTGGSDGAFKYFKTGVDEGYTLVRYKSNTTTEGSIHYAGSAFSPRAYSIVKDPNKKIVFAADFQKCRVMAISYGDTDTYYGGSVSLSANRMVKVTNSSSCGESFNKAWNNTGHRIRPYDLEVYTDAGETKGIFWAHYNRQTVGFINMSSSEITLGGRSIASGFLNTIFGKYNTADYSRGEPAYVNTLLYYPVGLKVVGGKLLVADRQNGKIARLDLSVASGESDDLIGNLKVGDYDNELPKNTNLRYLYYPRSLEYSNSDNSIYFNDHGNKRIRKMNLTTGAIITQIGRGSTGNADSQTEDPNDVYFRNVGDINVSTDGAYLFYTDYYGSNGANRNCQARLFNQTNSVQTLFNQVVPINKVNDIIGNYALGCNTWNSASYNNGQAINARLRYPVGISVNSDQTKMYLGDRSTHCIFEVGSNGILQEKIGQCNSSGDVNGPFLSAKFAYPGDFSTDSDLTLSASGNFFIVDRWITSNSYIKYTNFSASDVTFFGGVTIPAGEVGKIISTEGYSGGVATFGDQICYSQGANANGNSYAHNVICVNRSTGLTTLRVGRISASTAKAGTAHFDEEEGVIASSATLSAPWGVTFDSEGNLYISSHTAHNIRMVRRWF